MPGLVDAHCHVGIGPHGAVPLDEAVVQAQTDRDAGTLLIRDCGSPVDTRPLQDRADLPEIVRAGRHLGRPKRYIPGLGVELDDPALLPDAVREQARAGDGWVKLVGDWIDREVGDLAPLWPDDVLAAAIDAAHAEGARVTAHVFGTDALPGLIGAGIDCIEHGTGLTDDLIDEMARRGTALVPTLINIENFPGIADGARRFPSYAAHMRELYAGARDVVRRAVEAGVGGLRGHGRGRRHPARPDRGRGRGAARGRRARRAGRGELAGAGVAGPAGGGARGACGPDRLPRRSARRPRGAAPPGAGAAARPPVPPLSRGRPWPGARAEVSGRGRAHGGQPCTSWEVCTGGSRYARGGRDG